MAKKQPCGTFALRQGHETAFRRTIEISKGNKIQLVFEPGQTYDLSEAERKQCQDIIDAGLLQEVTFDPKGRMRYPSGKLAALDTETIVANLEAKIESLSAENAKLSAELAASTKSGNDDKTPNTDGQ